MPASHLVHVWSGRRGDRAEGILLHDSENDWRAETREDRKTDALGRIRRIAKYVLRRTGRIGVRQLWRRVDGPCHWEEPICQRLKFSGSCCPFLTALIKGRVSTTLIYRRPNRSSPATERVPAAGPPSSTGSRVRRRATIQFWSDRQAACTSRPVRISLPRTPSPAPTRRLPARPASPRALPP